MKGQFRIINSQHSLDSAIQEIRSTWELAKWLMMQLTTEKQRSQLQNNSLHLWCNQLAQTLNELGYDVKRFMAEVSQRSEVPWSGGSVKELIWRPTQLAYMGKTSTTQASTKDYVVIGDIINKAMGENIGIYVPWPSKETMGAKQ